MAASTPPATSTQWTEPGAHRVADGIHRIPLPLPNDGLRAINVYAIEDGDGVALLDTGWQHPATREALDLGLAELGLTTADITKLIVTHVHADHIGLAADLRDESGATMYFPETGLTGLRVALDAVREAQAKVERERILALHGAGPLAAGFPSANPMSTWRWAVPDRVLRDGDVIALADRELRVIWTPGHTIGHVSLLDDANAIFLAGDHVLPHITPSIGFEAFPEPLLLGHFMASLRKVRPLDVELVLPAHGPVFADLAGRVDELLTHHDERLRMCVDHVRAGHRQAIDVAGQLGWTRRETPFSNLDAFNAFLAVGETIAHLELLVHQGRIAQHDTPAAVSYSAGVA